MSAGISKVFTSRCFVTGWKHFGHRQWSLSHMLWNLDHVRVSHPIATRRSSALTMGRSSGSIGGSAWNRSSAASSCVLSAAAEAAVRLLPADHLAPAAQAAVSLEGTVVDRDEEEARLLAARRTWVAPLLSIPTLRMWREEKHSGMQVPNRPGSVSVNVTVDHLYLLASALSAQRPLPFGVLLGAQALSSCLYDPRISRAPGRLQ